MSLCWILVPSLFPVECSFQIFFHHPQCLYSLSPTNPLILCQMSPSFPRSSIHIPPLSSTASHSQILPPPPIYLLFRYKKRPGVQRCREPRNALLSPPQKYLWLCLIFYPRLLYLWVPHIPLPRVYCISEFLIFPYPAFTVSLSAS